LKRLVEGCDRVFAITREAWRPPVSEDDHDFSLSAAGGHV
jgi:hypothetical protein